jgi:pimeloyl-ACP methyl ester carboxylesterase
MSYAASHGVDILDAEGIERAALVCQSMGGWTGLGAALRHPERARCLVLCSTPGGVTSQRAVEARRRIQAQLLERGIRDVLFPAEAIHEVAAQIPGAEVHDFAGVGHSSYFEDPTTFNRVVGAFLEKHRA